MIPQEYINQPVSGLYRLIGGTLLVKDWYKSKDVKLSTKSSTRDPPMFLISQNV